MKTLAPTGWLYDIPEAIMNDFEGWDYPISSGTCRNQIRAAYTIPDCLETHAFGRHSASQNSRHTCISGYKHLDISVINLAGTRLDPSTMLHKCSTILAPRIITDISQHQQKVLTQVLNECPVTDSSDITGLAKFLIYVNCVRIVTG
jgi:hypothetical protein